MHSLIGSLVSQTDFKLFSSKFQLFGCRYGRRRYVSLTRVGTLPREMEEETSKKKIIVCKRVIIMIDNEL